MLSNNKKALLAGMIGLLCVGLGTSLTYNQNTHTSLAETCNHVGHHYDGIAATENSSGTHEYWVCCKCHEHFIHTPDHGSWIDSGVATAIDDKNDDRYVYPLTKPDQSGFTYERLEDDSLKVVGYTGDDKNIEIPEEVTEIDSNVFKGNTNINTVVIPSTVTKIDESAFENCTNMTEVVIGDSVEIIEKNAFKNCNNLTTIIIPDSVKTIEAGAFSECDKLTTIVMPASVISMGNKALYEDTNSWLVLGEQKEVVIYCELPNAATATAQYGKDWNAVASKSLFGIGIGKQTVYATVYYSNQWHMENGIPTLNK